MVVHTIVSYGLVLFTIHKNVVHYVVAKRQNSIAYIHLLTSRGLSKNEQNRYIKLLPNDERRVLQIHDAKTILDDLHGYDSQILPNFVILKQHITDFVHDNTDALNKRSLCDTALWEFPKGRRHNNESAVQCACREFVEETGITNFNVVISNPISIRFTGYDGRSYQNIFYIAFAPNKQQIQYKNNDFLICKKCVSDEMVNVDWMPYSQCNKVLDHKYKKVLNIVGRIIYKKIGVPP